MDPVTKQSLQAEAMASAHRLYDSKVVDLDHDEALHLVQRTLGAVYALLRAIDLGYVDDGKLARDQRGRTTATALKDGRAGDVGERFLADFYFNAALERLASVWDVILEKGESARSPQTPLTPEWNTLKHELAGLFASGRQLRAAEVATALPKITSVVIAQAKRSSPSS